MSKKTIAAIAVLAIITLSPIVNAAGEANSTPQQSPVQGNSPVGEWEFKSQMPERTSTATMKITKNAEGKYEGTWSTQWGESALSDIKFENGKLTFIQTGSFGGQEMKTTYEGTVVADGKIIGKAKGQWGDFTFEGTSLEETKTGDAIAGGWQMNIAIPAREIVEKLTIAKNADGVLVGKWEAQRGENTISDVKFEGGKLTFKRTIKFGDREFTMTFAGNVEGDNIKGAFSSDYGEREATATRIKPAAKAEEVKKPAEVKNAEPNMPADEKKN